MTEVYALLLAAGAGSRFGGDKLLAPLQGRTLVARVSGLLAQARAKGTLAGGVAVTPSGATALTSAVTAAGLVPVENPRAAEGLSTSLAVGLATLSEIEPPVSAALIVLADQPALRVEVIEAVIDAWRQSNRTTRPRYAGAPAEPGHPVLLDRRDWRLVDRLTGDQGFRHLLAGADVALVDVPGSNPDVDTPDDLRRLEESR